MIQTFRDPTTEDIYHGIDSRAARKIPPSVWPVAVRKLDMLNAAHEIGDLRMPPGNRLGALRGNLSGHHSIRINAQFRVVFRWKQGNATDVWITDSH